MRQIHQFRTLPPPPVDEAEKPLEEASAEAGGSDSAEIQEKASSPGDPVPMSLDWDSPIQDMSQSDESWTHLYERTRGDAAAANVSGNREKRAGSPELVPEKRLTHDVPRASFVSNTDAVKAYCSNQLSGVDAAQAIASLESAFTAWVSTQRERTLRQELTVEDEARLSDEVLVDKQRELDAWCKFQVFSPVLWREVSKGIADTCWALT